VPPFHPDYEPPEDDDGERYAEEDERARRGMVARVRRGSEGYEVRAIDRESLLAEFIANRGQEEGHYRRYVPEPPSEPDDSESGWEDGDVDGGRRDDVVVDDEENEPLAVRVEKWRSGEAIA
jgi:palmitoyltransferase